MCRPLRKLSPFAVGGSPFSCKSEPGESSSCRYRIDVFLRRALGIKFFDTLPIRAAEDSEMRMCIRIRRFASKNLGPSKHMSLRYLDFSGRVGTSFILYLGSSNIDRTVSGIRPMITAAMTNANVQRRYSDLTDPCLIITHPGYRAYFVRMP